MELERLGCIDVNLRSRNDTAITTIIRAVSDAAMSDVYVIQQLRSFHSEYCL